MSTPFTKFITKKLLFFFPLSSLDQNYGLGVSQKKIKKFLLLDLNCLGTIVFSECFLVVLIELMGFGYFRDIAIEQTDIILKGQPVIYLGNKGGEGFFDT